MIELDSRLQLDNSGEAARTIKRWRVGVRAFNAWQFGSRFNEDAPYGLPETYTWTTLRRTPEGNNWEVAHDLGYFYYRATQAISPGVKVLRYVKAERNYKYGTPLER